MSQSFFKLSYPRVVQSIFIVGILSALLLPHHEIYFPISRYAMFASQRPALEPLPFVEAVFSSQKEFVGVHVWHKGGVSQGRNILQSLSKHPHHRRKKICAQIAQKAYAHFKKQGHELKQIRILGGQFDRNDLLLRTDIKPKQSKLMQSCQP